MFCTQCGVQIQDQDRFCSQCGRPTGRAAMPSQAGWSRLSLPQDGKKIGGVCAGFARYFAMDVTLMRILWLTTAIFTGVGFVAYLIAWLIMPKDPVWTAPPVAQTAGQPG